MSLPDPMTDPSPYQGVALKRGLAWLVDMALILAVSALTIPFTVFLSLFVFPGVVLLVGFLYRLLTVASGSATWGMRLFGIEFRNLDGNRLDGQEALLHVLGYTVSLALSPLQLISVILMIVSPRGQGLTDLALNTTAVNSPRI